MLGPEIFFDSPVLLLDEAVEGGLGGFGLGTEVRVEGVVTGEAESIDTLVNCSVEVS